MEYIYNVLHKIGLMKIESEKFEKPSGYKNINSNSFIVKKCGNR